MLSKIDSENKNNNKTVEIPENNSVEPYSKDNKEERQIIGTKDNTLFIIERFEEYRYIESPKAQKAKNIGLEMANIGNIIFFVIPLIGIPMGIAGYITSAISSKIKIRQKRQIIIKKQYLIRSNIFNDKTSNEVSRTCIAEEKVEGDWEYLDY